ncbi:MAG: hypothetical protein AB1657_03025 [Candidatus Micrarchaeota archaeon]
MKHRSIRGNSGGAEIRRGRFEAYLLEGAPKRNMHRKLAAVDAAILCNLERAAEAPFPVRVKVAVLRDLYFSHQPAKTLLAMRALSGMAKAGSRAAKQALMEMSEKWLKDHSMRFSSEYLWAKGLVFILNSAELLGKGWLKARAREAAEEDPGIARTVAFWEKAIKKGCEVL